MATTSRCALLSGLVVAALVLLSAAAVQADDSPMDSLIPDGRPHLGFPIDIGKWAAVAGNFLVEKEGSAPKAKEQLSNFKSLVQGHLQDFQDTPLTSSLVQTLLEQLVSIADPTFYADASSKVVDSEAGVAVSNTFINYAPCAFVTTPGGVGIFDYGVNIQPTVIYIAPTGVNVQPQGVNVAPTLISVGPVGENIQPQGAAWVPAFITASPVAIANGSYAYSNTDVGVTIGTAPPV